MRRPSAWLNEQKMRLSRGVAPPQSGADAAAFLDGVIPRRERVPRRDDVGEPIRNDNSIAVVIGKKPVSQKPVSRRPALRKALQKPAPPDPARPVISHIPTLHATAIAMVSRAAAGSVAVLRHAYGVVFNPDDRHSQEAEKEDRLRAYLVRSFANQRRAGGRVLAIALVVGGGWATLMPLSGAVIVPGTVVSESGEFQIDAHLRPDQIDQVHSGQNAQVRFPSFNQRTTLELTGIVSHASSDIARDQQQSGPGYYTVRVSLPGQEFVRLHDRQLIGGMAAEVFIQTGSRTMMSYLFKPVTDQFQRMFRER